MTEVYFSFDTEDFTSNTASDAVRDQARILKAYGVKGNFNIVGYLARELVRSRRADVLDALKDHTVSFHSLRHSYHPTINEYTDLEDYAAARTEVERQESEGMGMVKAACGVDSFPAAVPPGNSLSYAAMYTYADWGIPLYLGSLFHTPDGAGVYFCNAFHTDYDYAMEQLFADGDYDVRAFLDGIAARRRVFLYNHPNRVLYRVFWDKVNYFGENRHPMHEWEEAPRCTAAETARYYHRLCELLEALQADGRFRICTVEDLRERALESMYGRTVTRAQLPAIREALKARFRWLTDPVPLSVADAFHAARHFLLHPDDTEYRPGKARGFLSEPQGVLETTELTKDEVRALAERCGPDEFLPPYFDISGRRVGPADLLFAMLDAALGTDRITLVPRPQQCAYEDTYPALRSLRLEGTWVHAKDFKDRFLSDRLRLQAWTIRPEE